MTEFPEQLRACWMALHGSPNVPDQIDLDKILAGVEACGQFWHPEN
jgi:hypothetical protein